MSLRSEAIAAYQADYEGQARALLGTVLAPFDVSSLTLQSLDITDRYALAVYGDGDITLGSQVFTDGTEDRVGLVKVGADGTVTLQAKVTSLAHLGEILPTYDPIDENATPA